ncbi:hypothetical protein ES703_73620 [subsurface metagenome]
MAALRLVEGAALAPIITVANVLNTLKAVVELPLVQHPNGSGVLEARHNLGEVREGFFRPVFRIAGHQKRRLIAQCEAAHTIEMPVQAGPFVVFHNAAQGLADIFGLEQIAEVADVGHILADKLVNKAAGAELVIGAGQVFCAHPHAQTRRYLRGVLRRPDMVLVILAVEKILVYPAFASLEEIPAGRGEIVLAEVTRHLLSRPQRP